VPVEWEAESQSRAGDTWTLAGGVVVHYRDYILRADKVVYNQSTSELEADGHLQVSGGPNDVLIDATHGDMRLNMHTARFYNVSGSQGIHSAGRAPVYSTSTPFLFTARVVLQTGDDNYRLIDGAMTNCRFPKPDWQIISHAINLENGTASTSNSFFKLEGVPIFYLPYLRHPIDENGRESGFLIPVLSNSSIKGFIVGEQVYWVINRSMDMVAGAEFFSKRGWAPNGDFRYKGRGLDHLILRWNALLDRGVEQQIGKTIAASAQPAATIPGPIGYVRVNQGGVDVVAEGRKDFTDKTYAAGTMEYLSSYLYRLVFNDNFSQAISSQVASDVGLTHVRDGRIPSVSLDRFETFASSSNGDEARILHLPSVRYDVLDRPMDGSPIYWGLGSSIGYLGRSEPRFHARNVGRIDVYPHISLPFGAGGWSVVPEGALRLTSYTISQTPDLTDLRHGVPAISHDALHRLDAEASLDIRPPAIERDYVLARWNRVMRHVIEPELTYRYVGGIGSQARDVLLVDTTDIATNTNEAGFSLTQRLLSAPHPKPAGSCTADAEAADQGLLPPTPREWASWQIAQKFFIDPNFGGALIPHRRNVFDSTLDMSAIAFLTSPRNLAPVTSRLRFEAIDNLRIQWDLDYDPMAGPFGLGQPLRRLQLGPHHHRRGPCHAQRRRREPRRTPPPSRASRCSPSSGHRQAERRRLQPGRQRRIRLCPRTDFNTGAYKPLYNWNCCGLTFGLPPTSAFAPNPSRRHPRRSIADQTMQPIPEANSR
jgi:LPS-assembly protein